MALYTFWGFKLDASVFLYIDSPKEALASVSVGFILLRVLAILLLIALNSWVLLKITPSVLTATRKRIAGTAGMLLLGGVLFIIIRGGVTESTSNIGQVYFSNEPFLNHSAVNPDFSLLSSMGNPRILHQSSISLMKRSGLHCLTDFILQQMGIVLFKS